MADARFEDGAERPLRLKAETSDDLQILSALVQDAIFTGADLNWNSKARRFDLLINRFRWEDADAAKRQSRAFERVRAVLSIEDVISVASQGVDKGDKDMILSLMSLDFVPSIDGMGALTLILSGDGAIKLELEAISLSLTDVTQPYIAPSGKAPTHPDV